MLYLHGWTKWENYASKASKFPDPLGIGSENSLALTVFAEVICSTTLVIGLFTRWSAFACMFTMGVAAFIVHQDDPVKVQEKALLYFAIYGALTTFGPGAFSVDYLRQRNTA